MTPAMNKLDLDYSIAPQAIQRWVWWLLASAVLAVGFAAWQYTQLQAERAGLALQLEALTDVKKTPATVPVAPKDQAVMKEQVKQANAVLAELGRPWPRLFSQLEVAAGPEIALLAIRPDAAKGQLRVIGEARHLGDVLEYVHRLVESGGFTDVVLEQHEVVEADPQKPVRFALSAHW
jgi:hypothetical protein